mmetsp:Transcript_111591/g.204381  ORF Transcript_111591/g.204381 Transcript_111591/m.204381 type:complete len:212 (+) Transcript_111591:683-1318(+)
MTAVKNRITTILRLAEDLLNDIRHLLCSVARHQVFQLPLLVLNGQEQNLGACLWIVHCWLDNEPLAIIGHGLASLEKIHSILQALHVSRLRARQACFDKHLVEGVLIVKLVAGCAVEGEDAHARRETLSQVSVGGALNGSRAGDDEIDALLLHYGLNGSLPFLRMHSWAWKHIMLCHIAAEACVAKLVWHDLSREHLVAIPPTSPGNSRGF